MWYAVGPWAEDPGDRTVNGLKGFPRTAVRAGKVPTAPPPRPTRHTPRRPTRPNGNTPVHQRQCDTPPAKARQDGATCASAAQGERFGRSKGPPCPTLPYRGTAPVNHDQNQNPLYPPPPRK